MKQYTRREKERGELAARDLSESAKAFYNGTEPLGIFEIDTDDGPRYDVRGMFDADRLTFEELQAAFEELQAALDEY